MQNEDRYPGRTVLAQAGGCEAEREGSNSGGVGEQWRVQVQKLGNTAANRRVMRSRVLGSEGKRQSAQEIVSTRTCAVGRLQVLHGGGVCEEVVMLIRFVLKLVAHTPRCQAVGPKRRTLWAQSDEPWSSQPHFGFRQFLFRACGDSCPATAISVPIRYYPHAFVNVPPRHTDDSLLMKLINRDCFCCCSHRACISARGCKHVVRSHFVP